MKKKLLIGILVFCVLTVVGLIVMRLIRGDDSDKLIGTWSVEVKHEDLNTGFSISMKNSPMDYVDYSEVDKTITYTFDEKGYYTAEVDLDEYIEEFTEAVKAGVTEYYQNAIDEEGLELSVEEYMDMVGDSFDSYIDQESIEELREEEGEAINGKYKLKGTKLYLSAGVEYEVDTSKGAPYQPISLEGDKLTFYRPDSPEFNIAIMNFYPLELTKEK